MDLLLHDIKYALRKLWGAPAFTLAAVATLAIGIGATTAIFSTVNATLLKPLPYHRSENLIALRTRYVNGRVTTGLLSAAEVARLNDAKGSIERVVLMSSSAFDVTLLRENAPPLQTSVYGVGAGFFELFELPMTRGAGFTPDQHAPVPPQPNAAPGLQQGPPPVVVLSYHAWTDFFGSDPAIVGKTVRFAEFSGTAVGVAARDLDMPTGADFWVNIRVPPQDVNHVFAAIVRAAPGTPLPRLRS